MNIKKMFSIFLLTLTSLWGQFANAGIIVGGTRVIFDGGQREVSLSVTNPDKIPYLIQAWTDAAGALGENKEAPKPPFLVTPPLFRLDSGNENMLRIIRTGGSLPEDRESIYWMNVKSIPASAKGKKNVLQISVKTRIKLIYRPEGLEPPTSEDYKKLSFHRVGNEIQVNNPTPYYITFFSLKAGNTQLDTSNVMVPPHGNSTYQLSTAVSATQVTWNIINDFGGNSNPEISPLQ
ncbi:molecular chaperone [Atlantibacter sp.]|uniref:fimbrial biogenesis chaperone n=1 Tax=Atlantibacter sp. TaxID=1903473 RepID=UPI0028B04EC8|nr:molecular chaperone [Atlantibacter sp.]